MIKMDKIKKENTTFLKLKTILKSEPFKKNYALLNHSLYAPKDNSSLNYYTNRIGNNISFKKSKSFIKENKYFTSRVRLTNEIKFLLDEYGKKEKNLIDEFKKKNKENSDFCHSFDLMKKFHKNSNILFSVDQINYILKEYLKKKKILFSKNDINKDVLNSNPLLMIERKDLNLHYMSQDFFNKSKASVPKLKEVKFIKKLQFQNDLNELKYDDSKKKNLSYDFLVVEKDNKNNSFNENNLEIDNPKDIYQNKIYISKIKNIIHKMSRCNEDLFDYKFSKKKRNYYLFKKSLSSFLNKSNNQNDSSINQIETSVSNKNSKKKENNKVIVNEQKIDLGHKSFNSSVKNKKNNDIIKNNKNIILNNSFCNKNINRHNNKECIDHMYKKAKKINRLNKEDISEILKLYLNRKGLNNINNFDSNRLFSFFQSLKYKSKLNNLRDSCRKVYSTLDRGMSYDTYQKIKKEESLNQQMTLLDTEFYKCLIKKLIKK